jgi:catechol 2,3-dioxygenase
MTVLIRQRRVARQAHIAWAEGTVMDNITTSEVVTPSREAWLQQLAFLQSKGAKFDRRVEHGMTHSLYIHDPNGYGIELLYELPRDVWAGDIDGALNYSVSLPTEGEEALADRTDNLPSFHRSR